MNNFPAMTEEQRQKMISDCQAEIVEIEKALTTWGEGWISYLQSKLTRQKIALAALTATPVAYMYKDRLHSEPRFSSHTRFGNWSQEDINEYEITETKLYTAPPAPMLRVPDGWIKCSERMPLHRQSVFGWQPNPGNVIECYREGIKWFYHYSDGPCGTITHWMPLPPPPEASNEQ